MNSEQKNITDYLYKFSQTNPEKLVFLHPKKFTYSKFCNLIDLYAAGFQKSGIQKGTKTVILIKPRIDLFAVTFALLRIGAIIIMIDPGMGNKAMAKALSKINAEAFIGIPKALLLKYIFRKEFKSVKLWISTGINLVRKGIRLSSIRKNENNRYTVAKLNDNDTVAVFFTSGSTGPPKGVVYKNYMFEAQLEYLKEHFKYNPNEIDLCTFPLIGLFSICLGLSVVLADMDMTRPATLKPAKIIKNINKFQCSYMFCSPMVLKKLTDYSHRKDIKLSSLKKIMTAGAPVSPELLQKFKNIISEDTKIHTPYGATEALPVTDINHKELLKLYEDSSSYLKGICIGYPLKNINLKIINITDTEIKKWADVVECINGEVGEIVIRGKNVSQNYFNNKRADKLSKIKDSTRHLLWHRTGDLGKLDDKKRVWFFGRKSQRVETNDKTLYTIPVEAVFNRHPAIERSALVGAKNNGNTEPVVCIQHKHRINKNKQLINELKMMAKENNLTNSISTFIFHKKFPVDPRHNAKIYREKLTIWAQKKII